MSHTPTPWVTIQKYNPDVAIIGAAQGATAHLATLHAHPDGDLHANADYIVKAVNAHAALVTALQSILDMKPISTANTTDFWLHRGEIERIARAALALAERRIL